MSIYTISSEDSDDNFDGVPPLVGPRDKGSCEDPDAVLMCQDSNANNVFNGRSLPCETDMDDDNAHILENKSVGDEHVSEMTVYPVQPLIASSTFSQHCSRSPDDIMELPDDPFSNGSISEDRFVLGSIPTSSTDFNNVKRKSAGSPKAKNDKTSNTALERQAKKQKLADERAARRTAAGMNKMYRPGECMKYINIEGHPNLLSRWYMANVSNEVSQLGAHVFQAIRLVHPAVLVWSRTIPRTLDTEGGQVRLSPLRQPCEHALYVADAEELCEMVSSHTLSSHLSQIRQLCDCKLTLLVFNVRDYFKKKGGSTQPSVHSAPRRRTSNSNRTPMTEIEFELAVTDLLVTANCDTLIANTASELASSIVQLTKAVAAAPAKKAQQDCDDKAGFFMRGDNKNCVAVDKDGVGVGRLWQQMLAILPQSSLETSRAICAQYRSPLALYESLQSSDSIAQLADIGVSRTGVEGSRARRVGPEFARKLHTLFTATDGNQIIE